MNQQPGGFSVAAGAMATIGRTLNPARGNGEDGLDSRTKLFMRVHQIPLGMIIIPISSGSGAYQMNDLFMPKAGYMWSIRRLTASGYTAGSVVAYKNGVVTGGNIVQSGDPFPFAAAGVTTIGRGELLLDQGDALVFAAGTQVPGGTAITLATGIAGVQISGAADCFERWLLPRYLGLE